VIGVYSLEGCVRQGFMPKLKAMDWTQAVVIPAESLKKSAQSSKGIHAILWLGSHLLYFIAAFLLLAIWLVRAIVRWRRKKRKARSEQFSTT
jgi:Kef-type K+ transport system membrane component KefB